MEGLNSDSLTWWSKYTEDTDNSPLLMYISWYWAIQTVTTVGYGDVPTYSSNEMLFSIVSMIVGVGLFGDFIGSLSDSSNTVIEEAERVEKQEKLNIIKNY